MNTNPDHFLREHFAALERRESPRCVSMEARSAGGYEAAQHAESAFAFSAGLMGTMQRTRRLSAVDVEVLRRFYLSLNNHHVAIIRMRSPGEEQARTIGVEDVTPGRAPPEAAEVQSWVSWAAMGEALGIERRECLAVWRRARTVVAEELRERAGRIDVVELDEEAIEVARKARGGRAPGARR